MAIPDDTALFQRFVEDFRFEDASPSVIARHRRLLERLTEDESPLPYEYRQSFSLGPGATFGDAARAILKAHHKRLL